MSNKLQENLEIILNEKKTRIIGNNIKMGVDILGVQGTFTSDATATPEDVVKGKIFYSRGQKMQGTLEGTPETTPTEHIQLKYIETDGEAYIDSGIKASSSIGAKLTVQSPISESTCFFGAWSNSKGLLFGQSSYSSNQYYAVAANSNWLFSETKIACNNNFHDFVYDPINKIVTIDGINVDFSAGNYNTGFDYNLYLFRPNQHWQYMSGVRISKCKIYDNGVLVRDFIPVKRINDGAICMYDLVSMKYFLNDGLGEFTAGPAVNIFEEQYKKVEYIESTGTQYIDTDFVFNNNCRLVLTGSNFSGACILHASNVYNSYGMSISINNGNLYWSYNGDLKISTNAAGKHTIDGYRSKVIVDGVQIYNTTTANTTTTFKEIRLFASRLGVDFGKLKFFSLQIYDNDVLARDFVPCYRKSDNMAGIYDKVTNVFFTNSGTGTFIVGPEL